MDPFLAEIRMFAGNFAPNGWFTCDGQLLPISQYSALFALLGTTYGGNGVSTFQLPDLRGRAPIHTGQGPGLSSYVLGQNGGVETVTLASTQMPAHNHLIGCSTNGADSNTPNNSVLAAPADATRAPINIYTAAANATMPATTVSSQRGSQPHENRQPYLTLTFIIAWQGIFPSRP